MTADGFSGAARRGWLLAGRSDSPGTDAPAASPPSEPTSHLPPPRTPPGPSWVYFAGVAVVLVLLLGAFLFFFVLPAHHPAPAGSSGDVIVASGHDYDVFVDQSSIVSFSLNGTTTLSGAFTTTYGITAYILTNSEYASYSHYGNVSAYEWTSGQVTSGSISESLPAGSWNLAFIDVTNQATSVLITSPITLTPS